MIFFLIIYKKKKQPQVKRRLNRRDNNSRNTIPEGCFIFSLNEVLLSMLSPLPMLNNPNPVYEALNLRCQLKFIVQLHEYTLCMLVHFLKVPMWFPDHTVFNIKRFSGISLPMHKMINFCYWQISSHSLCFI